MNAHVPVERVPPPTLVGAERTFIGLFIRVYFIVSAQVSLLRESESANVTDVGSLARVRSDVDVVVALARTG